MVNDIRVDGYIQHFGIIAQLLKWNKEDYHVHRALSSDNPSLLVLTKADLPPTILLRLPGAKDQSV